MLFIVLGIGVQHHMVVVPFIVLGIGVQHHVVVVPFQLYWFCIDSAPHNFSHSPFSSSFGALHSARVLGVCLNIYIYILYVILPQYRGYK